MSLIFFFIIQSKCHDSHFQWLNPIYLSRLTYCHVFTYSSLPSAYYLQLLPMPSPQPHSFRSQFSTPPLSPIPPQFHDPSLRLHYYTSIPSGFNSPLLATPCAPRGYLPPSSPHTSGLWPRLPPPKGRRREEGKRGGTPQGKDDLPLVLSAANLSSLFSYWSALAHAPPSSSDRARPPPQRPRPTQPRRGDPGQRDWDWSELKERLSSHRGLVYVNRTHPLAAPSPPARPRSVPQSVSSSFFPPSAELILSSRPARRAHLSRDMGGGGGGLEEGRDP